MSGRRRIEPGPGQESVWDYPRPPALEPVPETVRVEHPGVRGGRGAEGGRRVVARSCRALRILETSHPPVYYLPPESVADGALAASGRRSTFCEWKGAAVYWDLVGEGGEILVPAVAWSYPDPVERYRELADHLAFYPSKVAACFVGEERVEAQEGEFYGGWITSKIVGPFKGGAGTWGW